MGEALRKLKATERENGEGPRVSDPLQQLTNDRVALLLGRFMIENQMLLARVEVLAAKVKELSGDEATPLP